MIKYGKEQHESKRRISIFSPNPLTIQKSHQYLDKRWIYTWTTTKKIFFLAVAALKT